MTKQISDNEIYLLIKYIKGVLWKVAKCLSYIEEARCLKVNDIKLEGIDWIKLVQDRDKWWALVNMMVKYEVSGNLTV